MMLRLVLTLLFVASAAVVSAQTIPVRSGEHDGYTRLVVNVPEGTDWQLSHSKNGARLSVGLTNAVFETSSVFARLSSQRLSAVSQSQPGAPLNMEFGCNCAAKAFLFKNTMIVIDIAQGEPPQAVVPELPSSLLSHAKQPPERDAVPPTGLYEPLLHLAEQELEEKLMSRFLQGSDREVVDLELSQLGPRSTAGIVRPTFPLDLPAHIEVTSILDELKTLAEPPLQPLNPRVECVSDAELGFDSWSDGRTIVEQLVGLRAELYQEFDRVDQEVALRLAKLFAHSGFGAEAMQTLHLIDRPPPQAGWLHAIAGIVDGQPLPEANALTGMQRCEGDIALWALLSDGKLQPDARPTLIEQSFLRLPEHLRRQLGPRLAEILVNAQNLEAARRVLRSVGRIETPDRPDTTLARATIAAAAGEMETPDTLLTDVINHPAAEFEAPLALARLIERRWKDRGAVTQKQLELVASFAVELRNSDMGAVMARSHAVALSLNNEFDSAVEILAPHAQSVEWDGALNRVLQILAERADNLTFLKHAMGLTQQQISKLTTETALVLSGRFADLGFAKQTLQFASAGTDRSRQKDRARLRARAALQEGHTEMALQELHNDDSEQALRLKARALLENRDYVEAARIFEKIGEVETATRLLWLAGQKPGLASPPEGKVGKLVDLSRSLAEPISRAPDKPLSDAARLLEASGATRRAVAELLATAGGAS